MPPAERVERKQRHKLIAIKSRCPRCGASQGKPCTQEDGEPYERLHRERYYASGVYVARPPEMRGRLSPAQWIRAEAMLGKLVRRVVIDYTNHRGERARRTVTPVLVVFDTSEWHPKAQWLLVAYDHDRNALREFAMASVHSWEPEG